jgi:hypothetical protein
MYVDVYRMNCTVVKKTTTRSETERVDSTSIALELRALKRKLYDERLCTLIKKNKREEIKMDETKIIATGIQIH